MYRVTGGVDMHCLASRTGADGEAWCWTAPRTVPERTCLLLICLFFCVRGFAKGCVFESCGNGFPPGGLVLVVNVPVCGGKGWKRIRPFPLMGLHQIKEMALL